MSMSKSEVLALETSGGLVTDKDGDFWLAKDGGDCYRLSTGDINEWFTINLDSSVWGYLASEGGAGIYRLSKVPFFSRHKVHMVGLTQW